MNNFSEKYEAFSTKHLVTTWISCHHILRRCSLHVSRSIMQSQHETNCNGIHFTGILYFAWRDVKVAPSIWQYYISSAFDVHVCFHKMSWVLCKYQKMEKIWQHFNLKLEIIQARKPQLHQLFSTRLSLLPHYIAVVATFQLHACRKKKIVLRAQRNYIQVCLDTKTSMSYGF